MFWQTNREAKHRDREVMKKWGKFSHVYPLHNHIICVWKQPFPLSPPDNHIPRTIKIINFLPFVLSFVLICSTPPTISISPISKTLLFIYSIVKLYYFTVFKSCLLCIRRMSSFSGVPITPKRWADEEEEEGGGDKQVSILIVRQITDNSN